MLTVPNVPDRPQYVVWDITYACPLRCTFCYSESGRRPSRQLGAEDLHRVADAIIVDAPKSIALTGGEPLVVKEIFALARRFADAGILVHLFTSGWNLRPSMLDDLAEACHEVTVSIDSPYAETHDRYRGRAGSFDRAMKALAMLDQAARERRERGAKPLNFAIDVVVMRSNYDQMDEFCRTIAPQFPELSALLFGAVVPTGLASREGFAEHEVLTDEQMVELVSDGVKERLRAQLPASVELKMDDNLFYRYGPQQVAAGEAPFGLTIEADGDVRPMFIYEGTVGSLLTEPLSVLLKRAVARWSDPFVVEALGAVTTMAEWAAAVRKIDYHFGNDLVRERIDRRPVFPAPLPLSAP